VLRSFESVLYAISLYTTLLHNCASLILLSALHAVGKACTHHGVLQMYARRQHSALDGKPFTPSCNETVRMHACTNILQLGLVCHLVPEAPCWLIQQKRLDEAREVLLWLRGTCGVTEEDRHAVRAEIAAMKWAARCRRNQTVFAGWREVITRRDSTKRVSI
jgi:Sugar (and other) transporter